MCSVQWADVSVFVCANVCVVCVCAEVSVFVCADVCVVCSGQMCLCLCALMCV